MTSFVWQQTNRFIEEEEIEKIKNGAHESGENIMREENKENGGESKSIE